MNIYALVAEVLVVIALVLGAAFAVRGFNNSQRNEAVLEDRAVSAESTAALADEGRQKVEKLRQEADARANRRAAERDEALRQLAAQQKGYDDDRKSKPVDDWWRTPVPDAVRVRRHAGSPDGGDSAAVVRGAGGSPPTPSGH